MRFQRIAIAAAIAAGLAGLPFSQAKAQYYSYPCNPFPLFWPFCAAAAVVGTVGAVVTAPFRGAFYPYYPRYYYGTPAVPYYYPPTRRLLPAGRGVCTLALYAAGLHRAGHRRAAIAAADRTSPTLSDALPR